MRVLLAAGADVERMLDPAAGTPEAFLRHAARMPFLRSGGEAPLVAFAPADSNIEALLETRQRLIEIVPDLSDVTWLVYVVRAIRMPFFKAALNLGGTYDAGGGLVAWHVPLGSVGLVSGDTWLAGLDQRLSELLESNFESGVMPAEAPIPPLLRHVPSTVPAPPVELLVEDAKDASLLYSRMARRTTPPVAATASSAANAMHSTMPPNPRLRRG